MPYKDIETKRRKYREWWSKNSSKMSEINKEKYKNNILIREKRKTDSMKYYWENKDKVRITQNKYETLRKEKDTSFALRKNLRARIREALKGKAKKAKKTVELLGCDMNECRKWIESRFQPGMTWENYGDWHIDHIIPCASFDLTKPEEQLKCFHYTNLQPLWAEDNCRKSDKIEVLTSEGVFLV